MVEKLHVWPGVQPGILLIRAAALVPSVDLPICSRTRFANLVIVSRCETPVLQEAGSGACSVVCETGPCPPAGVPETALVSRKTCHARQELTSN